MLMEARLQLESVAYERGIAEVLGYDDPQDAQSVEMRRLVASLGVKAALEKISGIPADSAVAARIEAAYEKIGGAAL